ncbi:unnamed protein product [Prunus armeniaca]
MWDSVQVAAVVTRVMRISSPPSSRSRSDFWVGNLLGFCIIVTEHSRFSGSRRAVPSPPSCQARSGVNTWKVLPFGNQVMVLGNKGLGSQQIGLKLEGEREVWASISLL